MNKIIFTIVLISLSVVLSAETPNGFKYQAVVTDASGNLVKTQKVAYELSILKGDVSGSIVYTETHVDTTDSRGVSNLRIGQGNVVSGDFSAISWGEDDYYLKISMDMTGGTNYTVMGVSPLLSVPYSLYAEKAYDAEKLGGYSASQYSRTTHTHEPSSLLPVAQGYFRKDASYCWGCNNVESIVWNSTYNRYEITIEDVYFSNDDRAFISIHGDIGVCPAGAVGRVDSVSGKLLVYIVAADGSKIQCLFSFIAFQGQ